MNLEKKIKTYLSPPGNGVHTVHTAKENKDRLHESLYQTTSPNEVKKKWEQEIHSLTKNSLPLVLGISLDTGGGIQRGANWGPLFIREELLKTNAQTSYFDLGDVKVIPHLLHDKYLNQETIKKCQEAVYAGEKLPVSALSITEDICQELYKNNSSTKILGLGGDHSISYALVKPWLQNKNAKNIKAAIIHFDAHTDLMQARLGIDICFASWAYHMIEHLEKPSHLMQFGIRSSGQEKSYWESNLGIQQFWNYDFKDHGVSSVIDKTLKYLKDNEIEEVYISFDIDALDAKYASSTGTPEKDGLEPHECIQLIDAIASQTKVTGADLMEVAPFVQSSLKSKLSPEPDTTLLSAGLIASKLLEVLS